jgi:L-serine/L-threonine ammonia-lyase
MRNTVAVMESYGAEVLQEGESWTEANDHASKLVTFISRHSQLLLAQMLFLFLCQVTPAAAFIHPFDHELLWQGHSTIIDELMEAGVVPDAVVGPRCRSSSSSSISPLTQMLALSACDRLHSSNQVCSIGGGGLYIGLALGLRRHGLGHVPIVAVETIGCDSMSSAVRQGEHVTLPAITSIATTLGAKKIADKAWQLCQSHPTRCVTVTDAAAVHACRRFLDDHRVLVEPACGAALAAVYGNASELRGFQRVVVVVCGGSTCTAAMLEEWGRKYGV